MYKKKTKKNTFVISLSSFDSLPIYRKKRNSIWHNNNKQCYSLKLLFFKCFIILNCFIQTNLPHPTIFWFDGCYLLFLAYHHIYFLFIFFFYLLHRKFFTWMNWRCSNKEREIWRRHIHIHAYIKNKYICNKKSPHFVVTTITYWQSI